MLEPRSINTHSASAADSINREIISHFLFLSLESAETLGQLCMPAFINNTLFIPSDTPPALRQRIFLTIRFSDNKEEAAVIGNVVWINPSPTGIGGMNRKGFGIQLEGGSEELENIIERVGGNHAPA